jgi:hypothetical protein
MRRRRQSCCGWWVLLVAALICIAGGTSAVPPDLDSPVSPFGVGSCYINNRSVQDNERWIPQMAAIGLTSYRTPHCDWGSLEVKPGEWNWANLDAQMDYLDQHGFAYGCLVIGNPKWNEADPRGHLPVNNIEGWTNYVSQLARHVRRRTKRLEIWNEPPNFTGKDQTPADYAKLVVAAYDAAKAVDPAFEIGLAAKSSHVNFLKQVIDAGAKDHFDYVVLHPYEVLDGIVDNGGSEALLMNVVPTVRKMLADRNPAKQHVPVMYSELGVSADKGDDKQASGLVKAYALSIAGGVECLEWFEGRDGDSGPMGLIDGAGNPRPAYHALGRMIELLGQRPTYLGWTRSGERGLAFVFRGASRPVMVAWSQHGTRAPFAFGADVHVVDPVTGETKATRELNLTDVPVFVTELPAMLISQAEANRDKPLDWGGDFATTQEVSIEFGDEISEHGLHTRSGTELGEAVVAYGGSARAGSVPGGNVFIVDPQFLCYDKVPIEITAEVRRNQANDNAGFKLVYESPEGFKTAGSWYTIPDNKEWHTARWRIDDPEFVNYWGYNFVLESDGNQYNNYLIRRVSVRKLE